MSKDPAFLFYSSDFLVGTYTMTNEQIGKYIKLLCMQHQQGHLLESRMLNICGTYDEEIFSKFITDDSGRYYNARLEEEADKRHKYVESRRSARSKSDEDDVKIYLILDHETKYIKIGSSVNPKRRFAEICGQKKPAITVGKDRLYELIFESRVVPREEEIKLHSYFENNRVTGEWFDLSSKEIEYVRSTYGQRTEDENVNENINRDVITTTKRGPGGKQFTKPTLEEVTNYCRERNNSVSAQAWLDHYESNGWKVGPNSMKDWKAAVRTWEKRQFGSTGSTARKPSNIGNFDQRQYNDAALNGMYEEVRPE